MADPPADTPLGDPLADQAADNLARLVSALRRPSRKATDTLLAWQWLISLGGRRTRSEAGLVNGIALLLRSHPRVAQPAPLRPASSSCRAWRHWLPTFDGGRAFAVNAEQSIGKPVGAGVIFVSIFAVLALMFAHLNSTRVRVADLVAGHVGGNGRRLSR